MLLLFLSITANVGRSNYFINLVVFIFNQTINSSIYVLIFFICLIGIYLENIRLFSLTIYKSLTSSQGDSDEKRGS